MILVFIYCKVYIFNNKDVLEYLRISFFEEFWWFSFIVRYVFRKCVVVEGICVIIEFNFIVCR